MPRRFFNPLAATANGGNQQQFYAECMLMINVLFADRMQVGREDLKDGIVNLLLADHIESIDEMDTDAVSFGKPAVFAGSGRETLGESGQSPEERMANHVISYLANEEVGWIEEGIDSRTYSRTYMFTEQGMRLADYIQRASSMQLDEMSNYLYNTYLVLSDFTRHRKEWENNNPYTLVILNIYTNIKSLASSLKMLRRSIKRIEQRVTGRLTFQELMDNLGEYIDGDFIGEFTRLVDSENASLFRGPITAMLRQMMDSSKTEELFIRDCMKAEKEQHLTCEAARIQVYEQVTFIEDFLTDGYLHIVRDIRSQMVEYVMTVRLKLKMTMDIADNAQEVLGQFIRKLFGFFARNDAQLESYFAPMGYTMFVDRDYGIIMLRDRQEEKESPAINKKNFTIRESVIYCALAYIFMERMSGGLDRSILIRPDELTKTLEQFGIGAGFRTEFNKTQIEDALKTLQRFSLVSIRSSSRREKRPAMPSGIFGGNSRS